MTRRNTWKGAQEDTGITHALTVEHGCTQVLYVDGSARVVEEDGRELEMLATQLSAAVKAPCPKL